MVHTAWRVFLYGLVAATSPLALTTTLVVLRSGRGRLNGLLYAGAFLGASAVVLLLVVGVGVATSRADDGHPQIQAVLALLLGVALLATAGYVRRHPHEQRAASTRRTNRLAGMTDRLGHLGPLQAVGIGVALGIGGPKRLGITVLVAGTIAAAGLGTGEGLVIGAGYIVVGTVLVWLPVLLYVVAGRLAEEWIATAQRWVTDRQDGLAFWPSLAVGLVLVVDGLWYLVTR